MKVLITVCARGGSKGVPGKNIRQLMGRPLIQHTLLQARAALPEALVAVSSDSEEILAAARAVPGVNTVNRPAELAGDKISKLPAIRHAVIEIERREKIEFDYVIDMDPTSPLRRVSDINGSFKLFLEGNFENLITGSPARRSPYFNLVEGTAGGLVSLAKTPTVPVTCRQDAPECFDMNASIYIWDRASLFRLEKVIGEKTGLFLMDAESSVDIDHPLDFKIVEYIMAEREREAIL